MLIIISLCSFSIFDLYSYNAYGKGTPSIENNIHQLRTLETGSDIGNTITGTDRDDILKGTSSAEYYFGFSRK